jgi:hypothetical protein
MQINPPVLLALLLDLAERHRPDLAGPRHMGAAARLQIDRARGIGDPHQPHPPRPARRLDRHGFHEARIGIKLGIRDPFGRHRQIARNQSIQLRLECLLVLGALGHIEIKPPLVCRDRPARDRQRDQHRQQMQRGMDAHMPVAGLPVDLLTHTLANRRQARAFDRNQDYRPAFALHRRRDFRSTASPYDPARIARLPARGRVKDRPVQNDPAFVGQRHHLPLGLACKGVLDKKPLGHALSLPKALLRASGFLNQISRCAKGISIPSSAKRLAIWWFISDRTCPT